MQDAIVAGVESDVFDNVAIPAGKEHEITLHEGGDMWIDGLAGVGHLPRGPRKRHAVFAEYVLHEARAVETGGIRSTPHVRNAQKFVAGFDD